MIQLKELHIDNAAPAVKRVEFRLADQCYTLHDSDYVTDVVNLRTAFEIENTCNAAMLRTGDAIQAARGEKPICFEIDAAEFLQKLQAGLCHWSKHIELCNSVDTKQLHNVWLCQIDSDADDPWTPMALTKRDIIKHPGRLQLMYSIVAKRAFWVTVQKWLQLLLRDAREAPKLITTIHPDTSGTLMCSTHTGSYFVAALPNTCRWV